MKSKYVLFMLLLSICASANAEWFVRGTHNAWAATPLVSADAGTNTVQATDVVFTAAGNIKFDRFGDWTENYGVGGLNGTNIAVDAGTWDVKFFTDSKSWLITAAASTTPTPEAYHLRGTFNYWAENTLMTQIGTSAIYERCVNFSTGDTSGGPRFKIDPNGGWGDTIPVGDYLVNASWVKISFNAETRAITVQQNLGANCAAGSSSSSSSSTVGASPQGIYYLRGTHNAWAQDMLMTRISTFERFEACGYFKGGDANGGPRFKIDPNGDWGTDELPSTGEFNILLEGWALIVYDIPSGEISAQQDMPYNCARGPISSSGSISSSSVASSSSSSSAAVISSSAAVTSSSAASSSSALPTTAYHLRGTFNGWTENTLLKRIGTTNNYEQCINFVYSDAGGSTRFKIDPNGAWGGDEFPAAEYMVSPGWVKISLNSTTKVITTQENMPANCGVNVYHLRGTHNGWAEGDLFESVDGIQPLWKICRNFGQTFGGGSPLFKIDLNGGWGADAFPAADVPTTGWTSIVIEPGRLVSVTKDMTPNCVAAQ